MINIRIVTAKHAKIAVGDNGTIIGTLPLTATVYGLEGMEDNGNRLLYAEDGGTWYVITSPKIAEFPAAQRFVAGTYDGKRYVVISKPSSWLADR
jgi:hypothetical protein